MRPYSTDYQFPEGITLTPEQKEIRDKIIDENNECRRWQMEEEEIYQTEQLAKKVTYILDLVKDHLLIKDILSIKVKSKEEQLLEIVLPAVIAGNLEYGPESIVMQTKKIIKLMLGND